MIVALAGHPTAHSHGDLVAKHGGFVAWAGELGVELVLGKHGTDVYLEDHGTPIMVSGAKAIVSCATCSGSPTQVELRPLTGNMLSGNPLDNIAPNARLSVVVQMPDGQVSMARFRVERR